MQIERALLDTCLPLDLGQELRAHLVACLHALPPHAPDLLPQLGAVFARSHVDEQVAEDGDLKVQLRDHLLPSSMERERGLLIDVNELPVSHIISHSIPFPFSTLINGRASLLFAPPLLLLLILRSTFPAGSQSTCCTFVVLPSRPRCSLAGNPTESHAYFRALRLTTHFAF